MSDNNTPSLPESSAPLLPEEREQLKNLQALFAMPEVSAFLKKVLSAPLKSVDILPRGWTGSSNAPYYKEKHAMLVKPIIDKMIETGKPQLIQYSDCGYTWHTLNTLLNQGWLWLIDNLDTPENPAYQTWRNKVVINKTPNGAALYIKKDKTEEELKPLSSVEIGDSLESSKWRTELQDFLDNSPAGSKPKKWSGLNLTVEEQSDLDLSLSGLKDTIVYVIKANELIIAKKP